MLSHGDIVPHETGARLLDDPAILFASYVGQQSAVPADGPAATGPGG